MRWSWQNKKWPNFSYDASILAPLESEFLYRSGIFLGVLQHINEEEQAELKVNLICDEAFKTSLIEGEDLNRDSLQSSIRKNFGLKVKPKKIPAAEAGIAELMVDLYTNYSDSLSHEALHKWYSMIIYGSSDASDQHSYRTDDEPMQVVSGSVDNPKIHFEAPPAKRLKKEMNAFLEWFNKSHSQALPALTRAGLAHLYFVLIHPYDDGNGRIARALAEKSLFQSLDRATLIALSITIEKHRKKYYDALERANKDLDITDWLKYFAETILEAQEYSQQMLEFLVKKSKFYESHYKQLNSRQEKVISRIFEEGVDGFQGGLSAENYISITKTSRATATRDLQDLLDKGILIKQGQLKSTRYYLNL